MKELTVDLGQRAYPIHVGEGALALLGEELKRLLGRSTRGPHFRVSARRSRICRLQS